ncbi:MAG: hypothetical protein IKO76_06685 [Butyrivibrio sp.]|nr:hypothetical protein [Butyrivibrio sp.]
MAKGLICDRCGAVITKYSQMNEIKITPYIGVNVVAEVKAKHCDLCKDCTETLLQYINNEVQMILFKPQEAAGEETDTTGGKT